MKSTFVIAVLASATLAACGSKPKPSTMPAAKAGAQTDGKAGSSTGGAAAGSAMPASAGSDAGSAAAGADPCSGGR